MNTLLRDVYEYRNLLGRREIVAVPLEDAELNRLAELDRNLAWQPGTSGRRRRYQRVNVVMGGQIKVGRQHAAVDIANLGGGGLVVAPAPPLGRGELTVVRIVDAMASREYHFPAQVAWRNADAVGLAFFGIPIELRYNPGHAGGGLARAA